MEKMIRFVMDRRSVVVGAYRARWIPARINQQAGACTSTTNSISLPRSTGSLGGNCQESAADGHSVLLKESQKYPCEKRTIKEKTLQETQAELSKQVTLESGVCPVVEFSCLTPTSLFTTETMNSEDSDRIIHGHISHETQM